MEMVLKEELQYIGRTSPVGCPLGYEYYVLVYAGAVKEETGHRVRVETRLACTADASFYGFTTSGNASAGDVPVYGWNRRQIPENYWGDSGSLTEGGITYPRWTELAQGEVFLDGYPAGGQIPLNVSWVMESSASYGWFPNTGEAAEGSFCVNLAPLGVAAVPKFSDYYGVADGESELTVFLEGAADAFTYRVECLMGQTLMERLENVRGSCVLTFPPERWLPLIVNAPDTFNMANTDAPKIRVTTLDGAGNILGQAEARFEITVPAKFAPLVTLDALTPVSLLPVPFDGLFMQNLSAVKGTFTAVGQYGAAVVVSYMTVQGKSYGSDRNYSSEPLAIWGNTKVRITAVDSRGYEGFAEGQIYVHPYMSPVLILTQWGRCDLDGNLTDEGNRLKLTASGSCWTMPQGQILCTLELRWKVKGEAFGEWVALTGMTGSTVSFDAVVEAAVLDPKSSYVFQLRCRDTVGSCTVTELTVAAREVYMHRTANALGLGKYVEEEQLLDCGWNVWLRGSVRLGEAGLTLEEYIRNIIGGG